MRTAKLSVIVPVRDCQGYLERTLEPLLDAIREDGNAELVIVDNGSIDGTYEWLLAGYAECARILRLENCTISAVRNYGASVAEGSVLCFVDSDCLVAPGYLRSIREAFDHSLGDAVGCQYALPPAPHWIEATWYALHARQRDGIVEWLPAGNFSVLASAFHAVGGFKEDIITGEDAEICKRLRENGCAIFQSHTISAVHLGNPKSVHRFFRRDVWYALGMHGTFDRRSIDKPTAMMLLHLLLTVGAVTLALFTSVSPAARLTALVGSQLLVPSLTVAYRLHRQGSGFPGGAAAQPAWGRALFLYWLYYWARIRALQILLFRQAAEYRK